MTTLRVEIEDSGSDLDLSGLNREKGPRNVLVVASSDRVNNLGDQITILGEIILEGGADCVTIN